MSNGRKTAFLNGELEEEVFMTIPEGLAVSEEIKLMNIMKLRKTMYGLKVSRFNIFVNGINK